MSHLRMNFLFSNRIITRRYPVLDKPTHVFDWGWFYENGTYEYYSLFSYEKSIIRSYRSLKWHLLVIRYLNDNLENKMFEKIAKHISKKKKYHKSKHIVTTKNIQTFLKKIKLGVQYLLE